MGDEDKGEMCQDLAVRFCARIRPIQGVSGGDRKKRC